MQKFGFIARQFAIEQSEELANSSVANQGDKVPYVGGPFIGRGHSIEIKLDQMVLRLSRNQFLGGRSEKQSSMSVACSAAFPLGDRNRKAS